MKEALVLNGKDVFILGNPSFCGIFYCRKIIHLCAPSWGENTGVSKD